MEVIYERDPDVGNGYQAYRGRAQCSIGVKQFNGYHFEALLRLLHDNIQPEDTDIIFIRSDRPELQPYPLKADLVTLIKTDVEQAIQRMSHPDVRIVIGRNPQSPAVLKACGDTLAGAFGEYVLVRRRNGSVECPACGQWHNELHSCADCRVTFSAKAVNEQWMSVSVAALLASDKSKFFLPREWNNYQPWVSREKLESLYQQFMKTKEQFNDGQ